MCGIAALIGKQELSADWLRGMLNAVKHRGPDAEGESVFLNNRVLLGHRRLSIIDLSMSGKQPMSYMNGDYSITYNGEIYNYLELREVLSSLGYEFRTNTDTEVIMAAYDCWGQDCMHHFNGMWAFVLYDNRKKEIFLARDRFGVKPLYYWFSPYGFVAFASEIKQFFSLPGWHGTINGERCYDFLTFAICDHTNQTMYANVHQIKGGECALFSVDQHFSKADIRTWYKYQRKYFKGTFEEAVEKFRTLFFDAIRLRLRADVPVGSCLSGGLDSSSIVCVINELLQEEQYGTKQITISAGAKDKRYDELEYANMVLQERRNICGMTVYPDLENLFKVFPKLLYHHDEPFSSTSIYAQWCVFQTAQDNKLMVMLDGQGADEQLAGYSEFDRARYSGLLRSLQFLRLYRDAQANKAMRNIHYSLVFKTLRHILFGSAKRNKKILPPWLNTKKLQTIPRSINSLLLEQPSVYEEAVQQMFVFDLPVLLHHEDRNSMAFSVEGRLPFLDYRLVEFILSLPDEYRLSDGLTKKILRYAMKDILPDGVCNRMTKLGFVTPEETWMRTKPEFFKQRLNAAVEQSNGIFNANIVKMFDDMIEHNSGGSSEFWRVICFGEWLDSVV